jgi:hypothetical protein
MVENRELRKIIVREIYRFVFYCIIVIAISRYSAISRTVIGGETYTRFFPDLFALHLFAWILIYAIVRFIIWAVVALRKK